MKNSNKNAIKCDFLSHKIKTINTGYYPMKFDNSLECSQAYTNSGSDTW